MSKRVVEITFSYNKNPRTFFFKFTPKTKSDYIKDIVDEATELLCQKYPNLGPRIDWRFHGSENDVEFVDEDTPQQPCGRCLNANSDPTGELDPDYDFSSRSVGECDKGYRIMMNTGYHHNTDLTVEHWHEQHKQWETIGYYTPNYCPECGRQLFENKKGDNK